MSAVNLSTLDLPTLAALAGGAATEHLLGRIQDAGHPKIRTSHGYVFQHLIAGSPTVGELALRLGITQQGASKVVAELEALGYVEREADPEDTRIRRVGLTTKGRAVIERGRAARAKLEAEIVAEVGPKAMAGARKALVALLRKSGGMEAVAARRVKLPSR